MFYSKLHIKIFANLTCVYKTFLSSKKLCLESNHFNVPFVKDFSVYYNILIYVKRNLDNIKEILREILLSFYIDFLPMVF